MRKNAGEKPLGTEDLDEEGKISTTSSASQALPAQTPGVRRLGLKSPGSASSTRAEVSKSARQQARDQTEGRDKTRSSGLRGLPRRNDGTRQAPPAQLKIQVVEDPEVAELQRLRRERHLAGVCALVTRQLLTSRGRSARLAQIAVKLCDQTVYGEQIFDSHVTAAIQRLEAEGKLAVMPDGSLLLKLG